MYNAKWSNGMYNAFAGFVRQAYQLNRRLIEKAGTKRGSRSMESSAVLFCCSEHFAVSGLCARLTSSRLSAPGGFDVTSMGS